VVDEGVTETVVPDSEPGIQVYVLAPPAVKVHDPPEQIVADDAVAVIVGLAFTVMVSVAVVAHCVAGVNVYVVVAVLFSAGDQLPVMPFVDTVGKGDRVCPTQIGLTALKVGVAILLQ
jgi:uncharacterized membrane protein